MLPNSIHGIGIKLTVGFKVICYHLAFHRCTRQHRPPRITRTQTGRGLVETRQALQMSAKPLLCIDSCDVQSSQIRVPMADLLVCVRYTEYTNTLRNLRQVSKIRTLMIFTVQDSSLTGTVHLLDFLFAKTQDVVDEHLRRICS